MRTTLTEMQIRNAVAIGTGCHPTFWDSLNDDGRYVVEAITRAAKGELHAVPMTAEEAYPEIERRFLTEILEAADNPQEAAGPRHELTYIAVKGLLPTIGYSDDIFEVNYPDNIQVQIDRTQDTGIQLRVWKIGDDNPLATFDADLPGKVSIEDEKFLTDLRACLLPDYSNVYIYDGYDPDNPEDATFIVAGRWSIQKIGNEYALEIAVADHGSYDAPPDVTISEVGRFTNVWQLAERILIEDAKDKITNRLQVLNTEVSF